LRKFKEISKAVQLVAIAKLRKLQSVIESREYALSIAQGLFDDMNDVDDISDCTHCIVVITSERSCCGKRIGNQNPGKTACTITLGVTGDFYNTF
jgi:F0F1-type ATP synthase gamma subunit